MQEKYFYELKYLTQSMQQTLTQNCQHLPLSFS